MKRNKKREWKEFEIERFVFLGIKETNEIVRKGKKRRQGKII